MNLKLRGLSRAIPVVLILSVFILPVAVLSQEGEPQIIDQVVAQVNNDVITLSRVRRELREAIKARVQQGVSETQATEDVTRRQPELIASLVNEQLLLQKGKELDLTSEVEAEVNRRILEEGNRQGLKTLAELEAAMRQSGLDLGEIRSSLRTEIMKSFVIQREVDAKVFYGLSQDELKKYYEAHRDQFRKPESVTLSEIFLSLAGKPEAEVRARANQLVAQARGGADFGTLAVANSEREDGNVRIAAQTKGKVGTFEVPSLRPDIAAALKNTQAGGVTEPIRTDEGYQILRVDERTPGSEATYNENRVREAITMERSEQNRKAYLQQLRTDAYIKIAEEYRSAVEPLLNIAPKPAATTTVNNTNTTKKSDNKRP
ncbi:MAG TPA: peptidyl-prolyl cis-trans isomerase [Pyrinomonadaceae bacterium]|nr:peptidyl-prolyl cis-trans isomerase [Pyrinomonadaceae bacterium]